VPELLTLIVKIRLWPMFAGEPETLMVRTALGVNVPVYVGEGVRVWVGEGPAVLVIVAVG
jgi:hypothetical protein